MPYPTPTLALRVRQWAAGRGFTPLVVNLAWLLNHRFPVIGLVSIGLVSLPGLLTGRAIQLERPSQLSLEDTDLSPHPWRFTIGDGFVTA